MELEKSIESLSEQEIEKLLARLEEMKRERDAERCARLSTLRGDEYLAEAMKMDWLSWMRPLKIQPGGAYTNKGGEPSVELRSPDEEPLPAIVECEDLTRAFNGKKYERQHLWIQP